MHRGNIFYLRVISKYPMPFCMPMINGYIKCRSSLKCLGAGLTLRLHGPVYQFGVRDKISNVRGTNIFFM